jgi:methylmalonyl-CoA/ethylmalonyl-CoA epimerase
MELVGLKFHHLGLATKDEKKATNFLRGLGYSINESVYDPLQNVNLILCEHESYPDVEVIFPKNINDINSPLSSIFKFQSELVYHICYTTTDLELSIKNIKKLGLRVILISSKKRAILFNNKLVSFYKIVGFGIIEILELNEN